MEKYLQRNSSNNNRRNNNRNNNRRKKTKVSDTDGMIVCPYCGCDAWHIGSIWWRCFLCKATFGGKSMIAGSNVRKINRNLRNIKQANEQFEEFFREWFEEEVDGGYDE